MSKTLDRRVRQLETGSSHGADTGKWHLVLLQPEQSEAAAIASIHDWAPGDNLAIVRFVRPGDVRMPSVH